MSVIVDIFFHFCLCDSLTGSVSFVAIFLIFFESAISTEHVHLNRKNMAYRVYRLKKKFFFHDRCSC